jgi:hypothetical protein
VVNHSSRVLRDGAIRLRATRVPMTSRSELAMVESGQRSNRDGQAVPQGRIGFDAPLAPGAQRAFSLVVPLDVLGLGPFGVYPLTLEVTGDFGQGVRSLARERTFLPWSPAVKEYRELGVSWLWPVLGVPRRTGPDGIFRDDTLAEEITGGGRLGRLVTTGAQAPVTWVLDPDLLESVTDMADGYLVAGPRGPVEGAGREAAAQWLAALRGASADDEVVSLHFADVDAAGLVDAGLGGQVRAAADRGAGVVAGVLGRAVTTDVGWLVGGALDPAALSTQRAVGVRAAIVDGALLPRPSASLTPSARASLPARDAVTTALMADPELSRLATASGAGASPTLAAQRFLAETAMIVAESPGRARTVMVAPPRAWNPDTDALTGMLLADAEVPWTVPTSLATLRAMEPPAAGRSPTGRETATGRDTATENAGLPESHLAAVARLQARADNIADLLGDPAPARRTARDISLRLSSAAWADRPERADVLWGLQGAMEALEARVHIVPGGVTFGGRSGVLPITVVNDLEVAVTVRVALRAASEKLDIAPAEPITVAPRSSGQVVFPTEARATGIVYVDAQLLTATGDPYGPSVRKRVSITQYGTVGLLVTAGAALVLFGTATLRVVRRARGGRSGPPPPPGPAPAATAADVPQPVEQR